MTTDTLFFILSLLERVCIALGIIAVACLIGGYILYKTEVWFPEDKETRR